MTPEEQELTREHASETARRRRRAQQQSLADLRDPAQSDRIAAIRRYVRRLCEQGGRGQ